MAAEAYNETGNTAEAWRLLNQVRARAGATEYTDANYEELMKTRKATHDLTFIDDGSAQGRFRTALYWERGFELAFEGVRKFDLIRWGVLGDALRLFGAKENGLVAIAPVPDMQDKERGFESHGLHAFELAV